MLTRLLIDNYALIDKCEIDFGAGFTVITGETGAGKSIMLDALSLVMGNRADTKVIRDKERKMVVEAVFSNPSITLKDVLENNGIDWDGNEIILRREISPGGKSRGFVNDTPVNLALLAEIAGYLIEIHSQHSNSLLNDPHQQLAILDNFSGNEILLAEYKDAFHKYVSLRNKVNKIKSEIEKAKENRDFIIFRLEQLNKLKPKRGELASLEKEFEILSNSDRIKSDLNEAFDLLGGNGQSALKILQSASSLISDIDFSLFSENDNDNIVDRLSNLRIELRDISDTLEELGDRINSDPNRLEKVQSRIRDIEDTQKRMKVKSEEELVDLYLTLKREYEDIESGNPDLKSLESELKSLARELKEKASLLSEEREKVAVSLSEELTIKLKPLGLPNINFKVELKKGKLSSEGQDNVTFFCSFNKNHPMQPVSEIASGGEISRVMLGIKSMMADTRQLPTIIFDEIDTGVSGEIAHKMGGMMKKMSNGRQVLAVTHLPQVAATGSQHLKVYKEDDAEKTVSHIKKLDQEERIREIAGMLSGNTINEIALENARILLQSV